MMNLSALLFTVTMTTLVIVLEGYPHFQERLPNWNHVPHPCKPNFMWYGIGHNNSEGGGSRNVFGEAFQNWGFEWNICLCQEDSDGDGRTNGEELGDPDCVWTVGKTPERTTGLTHPGICDPFAGAECVNRNKWVDCKEGDFKCDAINATGVKNFTLSIERTAVPPKDTTYICRAFNLTTVLPPGESHLVATTPKIDNKIVMHHILVYGCHDDNAQSALERFAKPTECDMADGAKCQDVIGLWAVGSNGQCFYKNFGFLLGGKGYKTIILEYHWNNPQLKSDYTDASGMTFFVTTNKRPNDGGVWFIGPPAVYIPPGFREYNNTGGCSGACTELMLDKPIYLAQIIPHMHYLGTAFTFKVFRDGKMIYEYKMDTYYYDDPRSQKFKTPLKILPGDRLMVECVFNSKDKKEITFYGDSTQAEMCFGILMYYPQTPSITVCLTSNGYGFCNNTLYPNPFAKPGACNLDDFGRMVEEDYVKIVTNCDRNGLTCYPKCPAAIERLNNTNCLTSPETRDIVRSFYSRNTDEGKRILGCLASCDPRPAPIPGDNTGNKPSKCDIKPPVGGISHLRSGMNFVTTLFITFGLMCVL